ncbi:hypothetical protein BGX27_002386 [Mortierella sp. AM989]|nr:hypothetical protein BGX27_002386 [Mortierella sp. AM989]
MELTGMIEYLRRSDRGQVKIGLCLFCEFSLSYDGGKTYNRIGRYSKTCPDAYYRWPVKIPNNVPSCTTRGKCLFVWSWTANILPQYYHNCADITLTGIKDKSKARKPKTGIVIVDFPGRKRGVTAPGDGINHKSGGGPIKGEVARNMAGYYAK